MNFYKNKSKVLHLIRINQQLIFGMGSSPLSGTSRVKLESHKLKLIYNILSLPPKIQLYWDLQKRSARA